VVGYGGTVEVPTIDMIFSEISVVGSLVGNYTELSELMTLNADGKVKLHTQRYPWTTSARRSPTWSRGASKAGES
jgi:NAD+-dependent secondary alcohol dehydrogenase Adh1